MFPTNFLMPITLTLNLVRKNYGVDLRAEFERAFVNNVGLACFESTSTVVMSHVLEIFLKVNSVHKFQCRFVSLIGYKKRWFIRTIRQCLAWMGSTISVWQYFAWMGSAISVVDRLRPWYGLYILQWWLLCMDNLDEAMKINCFLFLVFYKVL